MAKQQPKGSRPAEKRLVKSDKRVTAQTSHAKTILYKKQQYNFDSSGSAWWMLNQRLPNPDRVLTNRGQTLTVYRELLSDAHLGATLESRESATLAYEWRIERGDCPARLFNIIEKWFFSIIERKLYVEDLSRDELTSNLLDVVYWGFQPAELSWDYAGGLWVPIQITPKPPEWFHFFINEHGVPELRFLSKQAPIHGEPPPDPWTLICPRIKPSYENPYGRGVAQRCFWPIIFKRAGLEFWLNCLERFGTPWVKGKIEGTAAQTDIEALDLSAVARRAVSLTAVGPEVTCKHARWISPAAQALATASSVRLSG